LFRSLRKILCTRSATFYVLVIHILTILCRRHAPKTNILRWYADKSLVAIRRYFSRLTDVILRANKSPTYLDGLWMLAGDAMRIKYFEDFYVIKIIDSLISKTLMSLEKWMLHTRIFLYHCFCALSFKTKFKTISNKISDKAQDV
jgi:hypothetical protein